ncbi:ParA family protein [Uliginosibacterium sp. H1]|uniref:ParA family protein n=1 Tax=Uliginosibacterium sp. H1 TaxID=3114757 RepID=UPI002E181DDF|nr:ParA family protein [Uliginosibacterium sp. H1]
MQVILVANPKGGVGKSTLATNLAGMLAHRGEDVRVMLGDTDRQQSTRYWLARRPKALPTISSWDIEAGQPAKPPKGTTHAVLDTPAALHGGALKDLLKRADRLVVPLQPSMFDILATRDFLNELAEFKASHGLPIGLVGMRLDPRTRSAEQFLRFVQTTGLPLVSALRDTQNYVHLAAYGMTVFDVGTVRVEKDREQWQAIDHWVP